MGQSLLKHYYRIDLRDIPDRYQRESLLKVLPTSPLPLKREVEKFAYYFRREFHYDFVQYEASESGPYTAYLFGSPEQTVWVGACCFRSRHFGDPRTPDIDIECEGLQWAWLHPYFRGRGILKKNWGTLRNRHGDFCSEPPLSPAMREFLLKHSKDSAWYPVYEGKRPDLADIKSKLMAASAGEGEGGSKS